LRTHWLLLLAATLVLIALVAAALWLWRRRNRPIAAPPDPLLELARNTAQATINHLNRINEEFGFETGTTELLGRLARLMGQLGHTDHVATYLHFMDLKATLVELLNEYRILADGRTGETGALLLHPNDGSAQQYNTSVYQELSEHVIKLAEAILRVQLEREALEHFCDETEFAIAQNVERITGARKRAEDAEVSLQELASEGYQVAKLRRQISAARGRLTQASTACALNNHRTAFEHIEAAGTLLTNVEASAAALPDRRTALEIQITAFELEIDGANTAIEPAASLLAQLRRWRNTNALAPARDVMATARRMVRELPSQMTQLRQHVEKYELDKAEAVVAALNEALRLIKGTHQAVRAHQQTLEVADRECFTKAAMTDLNLQELGQRIESRQGKQRPYKQSLETLQARLKAARIEARPNPVAALAEIKAIGDAASRLETRSATAHTKATEQ